ncbi:MAG: DMT family transporter [Eubacterium sp.]|nr:DMT family transporter [Eubacterium sp.]
MSKDIIKTELILFLTPFIWGFGFVAGKSVLSEVGPGWLNFFRSGIAALFLLPFMLRRNERWDRKTVRHGLVIGVIMFVNFSSQIIGLQYTSAGQNAFLCTTYVVMTPFVAWAMKRVRPSAFDFICAVIAIAGIAVLSLAADQSSFDPRGLIALGCPATAALGFVYTDQYAKNDDTYLLTWLQIAGAAVLCGLTAPAFGAYPSAISMRGVFSLLYMGICFSGVAFLCQNYGLAHASSEHTSVVLSLESVLGWVFGVLLLHEPVTINGVIGGALVFAAIMISVKENSTVQKAPGEKKLTEVDESAQNR